MHTFDFLRNGLPLVSEMYLHLARGKKAQITKEILQVWKLTPGLQSGID
jgi:hypothetical protein